MSSKKYQPSAIESKWQQNWKQQGLFSPDLKNAKRPYYSLMMFPYPSAEGLHVGNMYAFTGSDIHSRYMRMQGFDVFEPIGLDGFGIHSENYALKINRHPMELSKITEKRFYEQLNMIGNSFDWQRTVETYKPNYYKWTQWLFLQVYKKGLAYRKKAEVNWCPSCLTVLADEQVIASECERCGSKVIKKELEQWFFKITDYAERLLKNLDSINWSEKVKIAQKNWIGRSEGVLVKFEDIEVFTTRPDTIFGVTYLAISPKHQAVEKYTTKLQHKEVSEYIKISKNRAEEEKKEAQDKTGVFSGSYIKHPITKEQLPVWITDYILSGYGTGAVMGVPAHDARDFEFAKKYGLKIKPVIVPGKGILHPDPLENAYEGEGILIDSGQFTNLSSNVARFTISEHIQRDNIGKKQVQYHLRDWLISRQRYWGPPIPIVYCDKCGIVPIDEKDLPVELPYIENFRPTGSGKSPLALDENFVNVKCPSCGTSAKRETDVSDNFLDSAWYFLRYPSTDLDNKAFDTEHTKKWLPVDMYVGGAEHSVLHLLYSRFITMVLFDSAFIDFEEPFTRFEAHGLIIKEGAKMSKSKGNVVNPDEYVKEYGADTLRLYLMFIGPFSEGGDFRDAGIIGAYRFIQKVWNLLSKVENKKPDEDDLVNMNQAIQKVETDISDFKYNTAISSLMEWVGKMTAKKSVSKVEYSNLLRLLAPFAPHVTEELWQDLGEKGSVHLASWPQKDSSYLVQKTITIVVQVKGKMRDLIHIQKNLLGKQEELEKKALGSPKIQKFLGGKKPKKIIYAQGKVLNILI